jgi:hypothetical protein
VHRKTGPGCRGKGKTEVGPLRFELRIFAV